MKPATKTKTVTIKGSWMATIGFPACGDWKALVIDEDHFQLADGTTRSFYVVIMPDGMSATVADYRLV
jgi:hypothetical protein